MIRSIFTAAVVTLLLPVNVSAQQHAQWVDACGRHWHVDQRGLQYFEVQSECLVHRVYADPVQYEIARRVEGYLARAGFPPVRNGPVIDRRAFVSPRYSIFAEGTYHNPAAIDRLDDIDWQAAVRNGVRGAVILGFNRMESSGGELESPQGPSRNRLQQLVEQGVEDAVIEGFNGLRVAERVPPPAASLPDAGSNHEALPSPVIERKATQVETRADALTRHLAGDPAKLLKAKSYDRFETAEIGWYVDHDASIRPLDLGDSLVVGYLEPKSERADLWHEGQSLHKYVLFARYYEDALELKRKYY